MPEKKPLQTVRVGNQWEMYASEKERNPNTPITIVPPLEATITNNPTYQKYINKHLANIRLATQGAAIITQHEPAYHRTITANTVMAAIALLGIIIAFGKVAIKPPQPGTGEAVSDPIALSAFILGAAGIITSMGLTISITRAQDKQKREKEHFDNLVELKNRLPKVAEEIRLKDNVINRIIELLEINDRVRGANGPLTTANIRLNFSNSLAAALDSKDDLNVYESVKESLSDIGKARFIVIQANDVDERFKIFTILNQLLIGKLAERYYGQNALTFGGVHFNNIQTIYELFDTVSHNNFIYIGEPAGSAERFLFKTLTEALENYPKLQALTRLIDWIENHCNFNTTINVQHGSIAIVNLCYNALANETDYKSLINNLNYMFDDNGNAKQTNFINYIKNINGIVNPGITTIDGLITHFRNQAQANVNNISSYEDIIKSIVHTLASDEAFNLAINPNAAPKYKA